MENTSSDNKRQEMKDVGESKVLGERVSSRRVRDVPSFSGPQSELCSEYLPTKQELEQLARYWAWELLDVDFYCHTVNQSGSTELRIAQACDEKLYALEKVLGKATIDTIFAECREDFMREVGPDEWKNFTNGQRQRD